MCFCFVDLSVYSLSLLLTELRCTLVHLYLSSKYLLFVYHHFLTTTVCHSLPHLKIYWRVTFLSFCSFSQAQIFFFTLMLILQPSLLGNWPKVQWASLCKEILRILMFFGLLVCCSCHKDVKTIIGSQGHVTAAKTISLLMVWDSAPVEMWENLCEELSRHFET